MKAVMYFIIMALLLVSLPVRPATATVVDVIDFNKKCILIDSVLDVLLELPRDHTNSAVPNWINRFVVHNKQHLDGKAKGAYNNMLLVDKFFRKELNWKSVDNKNAPIILLTNLEEAPCGSEAVEAFFITHGQDYARVIAVYFGHKQAYEDMADDIDVLGHEFTHGVFHATQGRRVDFEVKSINEGVGDIFGTTIRAWYESGSNLALTRIREDSFKVGKNTGLILSKYWLKVVRAGSMRDNLNPSLDYPQPGADHYSLINRQNYHEVHSAGAVISHAYALLVTGKTISSDYGSFTIKGIGFDKAIKIVFYTLKNHLPFNTMPEFARAVKKSARKIHGRNSSEVVAVHNAFTAVGLFDRAMAEPQTRPEQPEQQEQQEQQEQELPVPTLDKNTLRLSPSTILLIFAGFIFVMMFAAWVLSRSRRHQLILQPQQSNATEIEPSQAFKDSSPPVKKSNVEQYPSQGKIPTHIIRDNKPLPISQSVAAVLNIQGQCFTLEMDDHPIILGRGNLLNLPTRLKEIFSEDDYMGREHCQVWYKAATRELYILCQSSNGMAVDGHDIEKNEKVKTDFDQAVNITLGKTRLMISLQ